MSDFTKCGLYKKDGTVILDEKEIKKRFEYKMPGMLNKVNFDGIDGYELILVLDGDVTVINDNCFESNKNLSEVKFLSPIYIIGSAAFANSYIERMDLSNVSCIRNNAFNNCLCLEDVITSDKTTSVGNSVFAHCLSLKNFKWFESVDNIGFATFECCTGLRTVSLKNVHSIMNNSFKDCIQLEKINFPQTLMLINDYAFAGCQSLKEAILPPSLIGFSPLVFDDCDDITVYYYGEQLDQSPQFFENPKNIKFVEILSLDELIALGSTITDANCELRKIENLLGEENDRF